MDRKVKQVLVDGYDEEGRRMPDFGKIGTVVECVVGIVLGLGVAGTVGEVVAEARWVERWMCSPAGLEGLLCSFGEVESDCTTVWLTADMDNERGTIQVSGMKVEDTRFSHTQFDRGWAWPVIDPKYVFVIANARTGVYYRSLSAAMNGEESAVFYCEREKN